jgi:hypothetical protein
MKRIVLLFLLVVIVGVLSFNNLGLKKDLEVAQETIDTHLKQDVRFDSEVSLMFITDIFHSEISNAIRDNYGLDEQSLAGFRFEKLTIGPSNNPDADYFFTFFVETHAGENSEKLGNDVIKFKVLIKDNLVNIDLSNYEKDAW